MSEELKRSPLHAVHEELGGRMVPFAGWEMPVMYGSILREHQAVREHAGIFDISHMGQLWASGPRAAAWLERMLTNRVAKLEVGRGQYTFLLNGAGGVIDDLILYRSGDEEFLLIVNAACIEADVAWLREHLDDGVELVDDSARWAAMAVQGPESAAVFAAVRPGDELPPRNGIARLGDGCVVCRTGYTGEDGFEFLAPAAEGERWFRGFVGAGAAACGLGARDSLRLEMGYPLNGSDLTPERTPLEAGLGFFVDLEKGDFSGREVLARQKQDGLAEKLCGLAYLDKGAPPRAHQPVVDEAGGVVGELSSGVLSPSLGKGIGMAYLPLALARPGTRLAVEVRGRRFPAEVVKKPFYKPAAKPA